MQRLDGHWVPKRVGIIEHYKGMTLSEIVLFDAYLLLANKHTWECWKTLKQLAEILPMRRRTVFNAKKSLLKKGWIERIDRTGVFIPKLYRYSDEKVKNGYQKVKNEHQTSFSENEQKVKNEHRKSEKCSQKVKNEHQKSEKCSPIIEEGYIIENDTYYLGSQNEENSGLCKLNDRIPERPYLHLLKSIPNYPFDYEKDLSFIRDLLVDFPGLDMEKEIKDWKTWLMDRKLKGKVNYRSRLRRWLTNSVRYGKEKAHGHQGGQPEAHGEKKDLSFREREKRKGFDLPSDYPIDAGGELYEED